MWCGRRKWWPEAVARSFFAVDKASRVVQMSSRSRVWACRAFCRRSWRAGLIGFRRRKSVARFTFEFVGLSAARWVESWVASVLHFSWRRRLPLGEEAGEVSSSVAYSHPGMGGNGVCWMLFAWLARCEGLTLERSKGAMASYRASVGAESDATCVGWSFARKGGVGSSSDILCGGLVGGLKCGGGGGAWEARGSDVVG